MPTDNKYELSQIGLSEQEITKYVIALLVGLCR